MKRILDRTFALGAFAAGAAMAYVGERSVLRKRLLAPSLEREPLGALRGTPVAVIGPGGGEISAELHGPDDAPVVVLVHSYGMTGGIWHEQVAALSQRLRLVTYDHPGHGRSAKPADGEYSLDLLADALKAVIDATTDGRPFVLAGHSLGGMTIMRFVRRHPDVLTRLRSIVLLSTTSKAAPEAVSLALGVQMLARLENAAERLAGGMARRAKYLSRVYRASTDLSFLATRSIGLSPSADPRYVDFTEQLFLDTDLEVVAKLLPSLIRLDEDEAFACMTMPVLIVVGDRDRITPLSNARRMAERCSDAELIVVKGVGHQSPLEARHTVNALLLRVAGEATSPRAA